MKRGRMSDSQVKSALMAAYLRYTDADLPEIVDRFLNRRGRTKKAKPSLEVQRFFDPARSEQGVYLGTPDCYVVAAEALSADQVAFLQAEIAKNRGGE